MIRKAASRKTPNNILTYTTLAGNLNTTTTDPIQYIVKLSSHQTINNSTSTTINNYYHSFPISTKKIKDYIRIINKITDKQKSNTIN